MRGTFCTNFVSIDKIRIVTLRVDNTRNPNTLILRRIVQRKTPVLGSGHVGIVSLKGTNETTINQTYQRGMCKILRVPPT
jgi:hypothetical protein